MLPIGWRFPAEGRDAQEPSDVAVVMVTLARACIARAFESIYRQDLAGTIQIVVGVDKLSEPIEPLLEALRARPRNVSAVVIDPGYSTSQRHGGVHRAFDGGAMRSILSLLANSRRITYLDDDNEWLPNHLSSLATALEGFDWAYSLRTFVDARNGRDICPDIWDAVGPGKGNKRDTLGGFADTNCLMIDKTRAEDALALWAMPLPQSNLWADRHVFLQLRRFHSVAWTGLSTVRYTIRPTFYLWPQIRAHLAQRAAGARPI
jgi:hypothetical protein